METRRLSRWAFYALLQAAAVFVPLLDSALYAAEFQTQFRLPPKTGDGTSPALALPQRLTYQYGYGSESDISYRANPDLDRRVPDDSLIMTPEWQGAITYRPTDWIETTLSLILSREFPIIEQPRIRLPDGEIVFSKKRETLLEADEAAVTIRSRKYSLDWTIGRQRIEDNRHWLYDTSMDNISISRVGALSVDLHAGRERIVDLETSRDIPDRIDTGILYIGYRSMGNLHSAGYTVFRHDQNTKGEGQPQLTGLRSSGLPSDNFRYWAELAHLGGRDELSRPFEGYAMDIGGIYRAEGLLAKPHVILGFAYATGDDPKDKKNNEFRQTGLQSNETRFGGIPDMKIYGETLDPQLSNLRVITAGLSFRAGQDVSLDLIYHRYRLNQIEEEIRDQQLTALMNKDKFQQTRDIGSALDMGIGIRRLFGLKRLGMDIRAGLFFPGPAFQNIENANVRSAFRFQDRFVPANKGMSVTTKFWW